MGRKNGVENGGQNRPKLFTEKQVEKALKKEIERMGGWCLKIHSSWFTGLPDRLVVVPGLPMRFVELKKLDGCLSRRQEWVIDRLRKFGVPVEILYGADDVKHYVQSLKMLKNGI